MEVDVTGQDISNLSMILRPGATLSGRVQFDAAVKPPPPDLTPLRVAAVLPRGSYSSTSGGTMMGTAIVSVAPVGVERDGTFSIRGLAPGRYVLRATIPSDVSQDWWLRSAMLDGRDLLDEPFTIGAEDLIDLVLWFTDKRTEIAGTLQSAAGLPAPEYFVVAFPADRALWRAGSRRIASARPDTSGAFAIRDLPGGEYLLAALTDLDATDLEDTVFLEALAAQSIRVAVSDGQRAVQNLRIAR
jgi:hypothetical protein